MRAISLAVHYECEFDFPDPSADLLFLLVEVTQCVYKLQAIIPFDFHRPIAPSRRSNVQTPRWLHDDEMPGLSTNKPGHPSSHM